MSSQNFEYLIIYNINIGVYTTNVDNDNKYAHFTNIWKDENINKFF